MKRLHSLDAMRAVLMLLGVYFHLAHAYAPWPMGWSQNPETVSMFFGIFIGSSNYFRMHAFFMIAGFFGAAALGSTATLGFGTLAMVGMAVTAVAALELL